MSTFRNVLIGILFIALLPILIPLALAWSLGYGLYLIGYVIVSEIENKKLDKRLGL